jgi:hypothetical protein
MKRYRVGILVLILGLLMATSAQALLFRVGPTNLPSPPQNGFPAWYQDNAGLALDNCVPNAAELAAGLCLITADLLPNPAAAISFPDNYPDEAFFWNATNVMTLPGGRATLVLALEAAFGTGNVVPGAQITFGRVRIVVDIPAPGGDYTVTHPFGQEVFSNVTAGRRAIFFTSDIGIGAPGDFTGALQSGVGPFLVAADAPGGAPLPLVTLLGSANSFLADPAIPVNVTGSPFGTNYFQICGPGLPTTPGLPPSCVRENLFTLMGKVHIGAIGSPLTVDRATYARDIAPISAHVDVFATAKSGPGAPVPALSMGDVAGAGMPSVTMHGPLAPFGLYYGQSVPIDPTAIPAEVIVTNTADVPPSSLTRKVVDVVTITGATYDPNSGLLTITATSSDKGAPPLIAPPSLTAVGLPGSATGADALVTTGNLNDPAEKRLLNFSVGLPATAVPPATVTVQSSAGGVHSEAVKPITDVPPSQFAAGLSVAVDDFVSVPAGTTPILFNILTNDRTNLGAAITAGTFTIIANPTHGSIAITAAGAVTYTPTSPAFVGDDTFTYRVTPTAPAAPASNVALVTVTTTAPVGGVVPIAVNDGPFSVGVSRALVIPAATLLANDSGNGGTLDPNSIQIVTATGGSAVFAAGAVTYTAGAVAGNFSFSYTVANTLATGGQRSAAATVSMTVVPAGDTLTIGQARFRSGIRRWDLNGTSTVSAGNTVTVTLVRTGQVIATNIPVVAGAWTFSQTGSNVIAVNGDSVRATSAAGGSATLAVQVRQ